MRKDGEQYLYNMTKGNIKLTRKVGAKRRSDRVIVERREQELDIETKQITTLFDICANLI